MGKRKRQEEEEQAPAAERLPIEILSRVVDPSLPFLGNYENAILLNCCGGILLCQGWNRTMEAPEYFVCNPATNREDLVGAACTRACAVAWSSDKLQFLFVFRPCRPLSLPRIRVRSERLLHDSKGLLI
ncbi:uncharacterized protein LOC119313230 [Triticum dicoccoides]|uniref:uncharacterized protein LOC119313230 n=1 Tax=Triticum dicoccoides TaxID=85692 RepID=UPI000843775F|nr:uncharacterized protein LOC119313230 [Triticum dicoccoides]